MFKEPITPLSPSLFSVVNVIENQNYVLSIKKFNNLKKKKKKTRNTKTNSTKCNLIIN